MRLSSTALCAAALVLITGTSAWAESNCCCLSGLGRWACPFGSEVASAKEVPTHTVASRTTSKSPSLVTKMSDGTKRFASNTKSMITPKKSATRGTKAVQSSKYSQDEKPGFFKSMFAPAEPPPPPKTIKEWMSLKQVHP